MKAYFPNLHSLHKQISTSPSLKISPKQKCGVDTVKPEVYQAHPNGHLDPTSKLLVLSRFVHNHPDMTTYRNGGVQA